ncbi:RluA family pseudouridine synthase [Hydrogenophaga sp. 5NK40-0174]
MVGEESEGQRIDNFLIRCLKGVPKSHIYRIIRSGEVRRNKGRVSAQDRVEVGDVIRVPPVRVSSRPDADVRAPARDFAILFEDDGFLAVDKPAGVAVHGGSGVSFGVIEQLRQSRPQARMLELVHRLDRETSGLLLVAKKRSALRSLQEQFRQRSTGKTYLTLVAGHWPQNLKVLDQPLYKYLQADGERRVRVCQAGDEGAMTALSLVKVAQRYTLGELHFSLLEVTIKTGRTHQIRVHLSSAGYPIAGDDKYGQFDLNKRLAKLGLKRMFLHAWRLRLINPSTDESLELHSELSVDLRDWLNTLGEQ